ncbi:AAA family ATPase [Bdellovibrionota bacterium FG-2]
MPHSRKRYLEPLLKNSMNLSPLVGVIGHRQVGKTTLVEQHAQRYYVLDQKKEQILAKDDPQAYLSARAGSWVALDECQNVPELFPELKEWVRTHKRPGQFILSGSVRFSSREAIKESLAGRIVNLELLPFTVTEAHSEPLSSFLINALEASDFSRWEHSLSPALPAIEKRHQQLKKYWDTGGLPGVCFLHDPKQRRFRIEEQLLTILDRDIRLVKKIQLPLGDIRAVLTALAEQQGGPLDLTRIRSESGVSLPTIKKLLYVFEAVFLIRPIRITGSTRGTCVFFEDLAEARHLTPQKGYSDLELFTHSLFLNLRSQFEYRLGETYSVFRFETRGGALVPLCFQTRIGSVGIIPVLSDEDAYRQNTGSIRSFLSKYAQSKILLVHLSKRPPQAISDRIMSVAAGTIL